MLTLDRLIIEFDKALRTALSSAQTLRPTPGDDLPEPELSPAEQKLSAALMRVNHAGEVCAQALYRGQALTAKEPEIQESMRAAASEETDHLAWTEQRIKQLGARKSILNPLWYLGSLALGAAAGTLDKKWNLGFLAETETQVERHLASHLERLPASDRKSRAIVVQMKQDESQHATTAIANGGAQLPFPVRALMSLSSQVMTRIAFWI
jgi:3-demethoxyubiquinol 3-hydroxylase